VYANKIRCLAITGTTLGRRVLDFTMRPAVLCLETDVIRQLVEYFADTPEEQLLRLLLHQGNSCFFVHTTNK